jgi:CYTH domain-containing protein
MEIERKFKIEKFPNLPIKQEAKIKQGYISINPEVRIRSKLKNGIFTYRLCFKSNGNLIRQETELELTEDKFNELLCMINGELITKDYKVYDLDGYNLECSLVDEGKLTEFMYAEIEFESEEQANQFIPPKDYFDITNDSSWKMKNYWERTRK